MVDLQYAEIIVDETGEVFHANGSIMPGEENVEGTSASMAIGLQAKTFHGVNSFFLACHEQDGQAEARKRRLEESERETSLIVSSEVQ